MTSQTLVNRPFLPMTLSLFQDLPQRLLRGLDILISRFVCFLLERVQDVDGIHKHCHVNHPKLTLMHDADFADTRSNGRHRSPIIRLQFALNSIELVLHLSVHT